MTARQVAKRRGVHVSSAFLAADLQVVQHALALLGGDRRAHIGALLDTRTDGQLAGARDDLVQQLIGDGLDHDRATRRGAALAGGAEGAVHDACRGQIEVRVGQHDRGVLAAQLGLDRDAARRATGRDVTPG